MKKFLLFALCAISAASSFAEPYSKAKSLQLKGVQLLKYSYEAQVSKETDYRQPLRAMKYVKEELKQTMNAQQVQQFMAKYKNSFTTKDFEVITAQVAAEFGNYDFAIEFFKKHPDRYILERLSNNGYKKEIIKNNYYWKLANVVLLQDGGCANVLQANTILTEAFRFKSSTVTKEQQIEFLSKLAQIYPVPGTDFNQWKGFMGFVGFKYKQLTGKELF